jgi:hypothetical protein
VLGKCPGNQGLQSVPGSTRAEPPGARELETACDEDIWTCRGGGCIRSAFEEAKTEIPVQFISYTGSCWATMARIYAAAPWNGA